MSHVPLTLGDLSLELLDADRCVYPPPAAEAIGDPVQVVLKRLEGELEIVGRLVARFGR